MKDNKFIFSITTGRSGSAYLTLIMNRFKSAVAFHEPGPAFVDCMREIQKNPEKATRFLLEQKLPDITKRLSSNKIYIETSHLFGKGFLEPWLQLDGVPTPDLIILNRDYRKVSKSMVNLMTIPGRTEDGLTWYLSPDDPTCFTYLENWESLNDYQLCYWYCLEIEERKKRYKDLIVKNGGRWVETSIDELKTLKGILKINRRLQLNGLTFRNWVKYLRLRNSKKNTKISEKKKIQFQYSDTELDAFEKKVNERISTNPKLTY